jgi:hypothetical protein
MIPAAKFDKKSPAANFPASSENFRGASVFSVEKSAEKRVGLDNLNASVILAKSEVGAINRQTDREVGAQSEGPRASEVAWLPKPNMLTKGVSVRFRPVSFTHRRDRGVRWMLGPGLFLALLLLAGGPARAETAVGLDARGVDPMAAVSNPLGLDVRDTLGRSVSGKVVLAEMKQAQAARAAETSYASSLPKARTVLPLLEAAAGRGLSLVRLIESAAGPAAWASLPSPRPKPAALILAVLGVLLIQAASVLRPRASRPALSSCRRCLEVLRC